MHDRAHTTGQADSRTDPTRERPRANRVPDVLERSRTGAPAQDGGYRRLSRSLTTASRSQSRSARATVVLFPCVDFSAPEFGQSANPLADPYAPGLEFTQIRSASATATLLPALAPMPWRRADVIRSASLRRRQPPLRSAPLAS